MTEYPIARASVAVHHADCREAAEAMKQIIGRDLFDKW
jgi:hypothetical protein